MKKLFFASVMFIVMCLPVSAKSINNTIKQLVVKSYEIGYSTEDINSCKDLKDYTYMELRENIDDEEVLTELTDIIYKACEIGVKDKVYLDKPEHLKDIINLLK